MQKQKIDLNILQLWIIIFYQLHSFLHSIWCWAFTLSFMFVRWCELRFIITAFFIQHLLWLVCRGDNVDHVSCRIPGMSDWHLSCDHFYILVLLPPFKHLPSSLQHMWRRPHSNDNSSSWASAATTSQGLKWSKEERWEERLSPPSISEPDSTFFTSPLLSVQGTSSAVTKIAFSFPRFDKCPAFLLSKTKLLSYNHKAEAINGDNCIDSQEKRLYKFSLHS